MKSNDDLRNFSTEQLVERFIEFGVLQGKASEQFETAKFNRLYKRIEAIVRELRSRPGDQRAALLYLRDHTNLQVRYNAAQRTYILDPEGWEATLHSIVATRRFPWAGDAGMSLKMHEMGLSRLAEDL